MSERREEADPYATAKFGTRLAGCCLALLALDSGLFGTGIGAEEAIGADVEKLMPAVVLAASDGDFETAWTNYRRAYLLAHGSEQVKAFMNEYCGSNRCPAIWDIAWLLGKPKSELAFLDGFCHNTENSMCAPWLAAVREGKSYLDETAGVAMQPAQELEFEFIHAEEFGDMRPWTVVEIGDEAIWGVFDSAGYEISIGVGKDWAHLRNLNHEMLSGPLLGRDGDGVFRTRRKVVLREFTLESVTESRVAATVVDKPQNYAAVGMNILLRYRAACFSWTDTTLYLGRLGPCRGGEQPFEAALRARTGQPLVWLPGEDGVSIPVLVDTGAHETDCKISFMQRQEGHPFRFGDHPDLKALCNAASTTPIHPEYPFPASIGMETLTKFDAFGWELNPFRMYFVPKRPADGESTDHREN